VVIGALAPSLGVDADNLFVWAIADVAFNAGEVGMFDLPRGSSNTTNDQVGSLNSSTVRVVAPTSGGIICGLLGVWQNDVAVGGRAKLLLRGETTAKVIKASGNVARADRLCATTAKFLSPDHSAGDRVIAIAREPLTAPTTATSGLVWFDGVNGLSVFTS